MEMNLDLEEIILYLNANEPTGKYCKNIENLKNALTELKAIKEAKPSKRKYYEIEKIIEYKSGLVITESFCLVESKEVAEHWCKIHKKYTYNEIEVEEDE